MIVKHKYNQSAHLQILIKVYDNSNYFKFALYFCHIIRSFFTYYLVCNFYSKFTLIIITSLYSSFLTGYSDDIKTFTLSDGSGYFITGYDSSGKANIWKYTDMRIKFSIIVINYYMLNIINLLYSAIQYLEIFRYALFSHLNQNMKLILIILK